MTSQTALMLVYWFAIQVLAGLPSLGQNGGGVAFWAHIGGFLAGVGWAVLELIRSPAPSRSKRR